MRQPRLPGAATRAARPEDFERHAWLVFQHPSLNQNFWWMERDGARQRIDQPRPRTGQRQLRLPARPPAGRAGPAVLSAVGVAPLLGEGRLVRLLGDYHFDPGPFGPSIHVLYPGHRRNTRKVRAFLEHLRASLQRQGLCHRL
ncbi:LysR substrate-binding domain-containing protein [Pseudomonas aeruginosa]|nr:LysR substrate-binding domain-containing protein [Pseudomonas aeruginosa]